eukprot:2699599-Prymnesium_polylepis.2
MASSMATCPIAELALPHHLQALCDMGGARAFQLGLLLLLACACGALRLPAASQPLAGHALQPVARRSAVMLAKKSAAKSKDVQVLLSADIKGIGKAGEVRYARRTPQYAALGQLNGSCGALGCVRQLVSVKPAYAQNFITAQGLGKIATAQILADLEQKKAEAAAAAVAAKEAAQALAEKLDAKFGIKTDGIVVKKKAGPSGEIFGKVTSADVSRLIKERSKEEIDKRKIS